MEAEEKDLSVGVVCTKKDEEPGPCGSAAHFLLGMDMEGDPPVTEMVEGDALMAVSADLCFKTNYSNQCQFSCPINVAAAVNDDQVDAGFAVDDDSDIESTAPASNNDHVDFAINEDSNIESTAAVDNAEVDKDQVDNVQDFETTTALVDGDQVKEEIAVDKHLQYPVITSR